MRKRKSGKSRRRYSDDLKAEAVQMLLDGHSAESVVSRLGLSGTSLLYRWKSNLISASGPAATALETRVQELEKDVARAREDYETAVSLDKEDAEAATGLALSDLKLSISTQGFLKKLRKLPLEQSSSYPCAYIGQRHSNR